MMKNRTQAVISATEDEASNNDDGYHTHPKTPQQPQKLITQQQETTRVPSSLSSRCDRTSNPFNVFQERVVVAMVGLPARGKSYISRYVVRYLNFLGCPARLFNAGNVRRDVGLTGTDASFFDASNSTAKRVRDRLAMECLESLLTWLRDVRGDEEGSSVDGGGGGCAVGILDATNTTRARRAAVRERVRRETASRDPHLRLVFVESLVDDEELLEHNYQMKLQNDDYRDQDPEKAMADFRERVRQYEAVYEPVEDDEADDEDDNNDDRPLPAPGSDLKYIKLINAGQKLVSNNLNSGYVYRRIQRLLSSIHLKDRTVWIVLNGETENDVRGVLGGDPELSPDGVVYAREVRDVVVERGRRSSAENAVRPLRILTGTLRRYAATAAVLRETTRETQLLTLAAANDLCTGLLDSLTVEERETRYPRETAARRADPLNYRYPGVGGESYQDLIARCSEIATLLEQSRGDSVVVADRAVCRAMAAYFLGHSIEQVPTLDVQPGVLELRRNHKGFRATRLRLTRGKATTQAGPGRRYGNERDSLGKLRSQIEPSSD